MHCLSQVYCVLSSNIIFHLFCNVSECVWLLIWGKHHYCCVQVLSYRKQKVGVGRMSSVNSDASLVLSFTVFVQVKKEPVKLFFSHHTPQESEITHLMSPWDSFLYFKTFTFLSSHPLKPSLFPVLCYTTPNSHDTWWGHLCFSLSDSYLFEQSSRSKTNFIKNIKERKKKIPWIKK